MMEFFDRPMYLVLDAEHNVIALPHDPFDDPTNLFIWARTFENFEDRRVAQTTICRWWGCVWVSTMFLGMDLSFRFDPDEPPLVFETMAFSVLPRVWRGDEWGDTQDRYATWAEAVAGHWAIVEKVRAHKGTLREAWHSWTAPLRESYEQHLRNLGLPMQPIEEEHG